MKGESGSLCLIPLFDPVPHKAIDTALERLGLPKYVRESIMNSYTKLSTASEYGGTKSQMSICWGSRFVLGDHDKTRGTLPRHIQILPKVK